MVERSGNTDGSHDRRLVEHGDANGVSAHRIHLPGLRIDIDERPGARCGRRVQLVDQELQRAPWTVAVVLDFIDAEHVRMHGRDRRHGLRPLPVEFGLGIGAAAIGGRTGHAVAAVVDRVREAIKRIEEVQQVHPDNPHRPADGGRRRRTRVRLDDVHRTAERTDWTHAKGRAADRVAAPGVGQHADEASDRVATAERVRRGQRSAASRKRNRVRVLRLRAIIENDPVEVVPDLQRQRWRTGSHDVRWLLETAVRQRHLAETSELEVLGDRECLREAHQHAFVCLERIGRGHRQAHVDGSDRTDATLRDRADADL